MGVTIHLFMDYLRIDYFPGMWLSAFTDDDDDDVQTIIPQEM